MRGKYKTAEEAMNGFLTELDLDSYGGALTEGARKQICYAPYLFDGLAENEARVLRMIYGFDGKTYSLKEVGDQLVKPVSRERVRQIKVRALRKMRHPKIKKPLKDFLRTEYERDVQYGEFGPHIRLLYERLKEISSAVETVRESVDSVYAFIRESQHPQSELRRILDQPIDVLEYPTRFYNVLVLMNVKTIRDLASRQETDYLNANGIGPKTTQKIKTDLDSMGLRLGLQFDKNGNLLPEHSEEVRRRLSEIPV